MQKLRLGLWSLILVHSVHLIYSLAFDTQPLFHFAFLIHLIRHVFLSTALRAAAAAVKQEDDRRLFHNAALRKRRKEMGDQMDPIRRSNRVCLDEVPDISISWCFLDFGLCI